MPKLPPDRGDLIFSPDRGVVARPGGGASGSGKAKPKQGKRGRQAERAEIPDDGVVRVARERRRGKGVTRVTGVPLGGAELTKLGQLLKARCGAGGTTKDGVIEIQGDHRDVIVPELESRGWTVKRVGG